MTPTVTVVAEEGDLLTTPAEAIVNPWNRNFVPRWLLIPDGVSGKLKRLTGPEPWRELARMGTLPLGAAVVTGPGRMQGPRHLIHVAGLTAWWRATPASVAASARNAVLAASELGVTTLAMPLIGSGSGGLSEHESRQAIHEGLSTFKASDRTGPADLNVTVVTRARR